jgi:hypothetical protein
MPSSDALRHARRLGICFVVGSATGGLVALVAAVVFAARALAGVVLIAITHS